jgi:azurin
MDYYLEYTLRETLRQLEPWWRRAIAEGQAIAAHNPAGLDYLVGRLTTPELLRLPRTAGVLEAIVTRGDAADGDRAAALLEWARARQMPQVTLALETLDRRAADPAVAGSVARLLPLQAPDDLRAARDRLVRLATGGTAVEVRESGWAALALADAGFDQLWRLGSESPRALTDLLGGIPLLLDSGLRARAYDRVKPLLTQVPPELAAKLGAGPTRGRFVRIELPRTGTLTLAEVEVFSGGRNVALGGRARQSSTAHGGDAARAIDGRTDGAFARGAQTHTQEDRALPWWEVDLGGEHPVDEVVVWNRTDGNLGRRLEGFTVKVLDGGRREVWVSEGNPAPAVHARLVVGGDPLGALREAAIRALVSMNHEPEAVFDGLARLVGQGELVVAAAQGLRVVPRASWPRAVAGETATALAAWAQSVPAGQRTALDYIETVQFADDLAGFLPAARAAEVRGALRELRVPVFVIRAVREQMRFDTARLVVEAGKPFELVVENPDFMPHNLVVVRPGTRDRVGVAAAMMRPEDLDARGRAFVPASDAVLAATRMLVSGERETLQLTAPDEAGDYEFVCTFPGHHQVMWGWLIVTGDVDAYLEQHPEARPAGTGAQDDEHHGHFH